MLKTVSKGTFAQATTVSFGGTLKQVNWRPLEGALTCTLPATEAKHLKQTATCSIV